MSKDNLEANWAMGQNEEEHDTVTLTLDDDTELECLVLTTLEVGGKKYIALLPLEEDEEEEEEGTVFLYHLVTKENDEIELINIENDDEFDAVSEAFDQYLDSMEFEEVFGEEEEEEK
ncbi:MAG: DUF1292 domain-containing protein [Acetivibrio sp.]